MIHINNFTLLWYLVKYSIQVVSQPHASCSHQQNSGIILIEYLHPFFLHFNQLGFFWHEDLLFSTRTASLLRTNGVKQVGGIVLLWVFVDLIKSTSTGMKHGHNQVVQQKKNSFVEDKADYLLEWPQCKPSTLGHCQETNRSKWTQPSMIVKVVKYSERTINKTLFMGTKNVHFFLLVGN